MNQALKRLIPDSLLPLARGVRSILKLVAQDLCALLFGLPLLVVVWLFEPFHKLRFIHIGRVNHIGWIAVNCYSYLGRWKLHGRPENTTFFVLMFDPDNQFLFDIFNREMNVVSSPVLNYIANLVAPLMRATGFFVYEHEDPASYESWSKVNGVVTLSEEDEKCGQRKLAEMGIGPDDWFVCFHNRDSAYYDNPYHEYRNCTLGSYLKAAQYITEKGGFAIRMGANVTDPLPDHGNPKIIDYALSHRSAFMDIYLSAKCRFFLGNTSGIIVVPPMFGKPIAAANFMPYCTPDAKLGWPWIPKLLRCAKSGRYLTFREIFDLGMFSPGMKSPQFTETCQRLGLDIVESSEDDIYDLALDMFDILSDVTPPEAAAAIQRHYKEQFLSFRDRLEEVPDISARFAIRHKDLILT